MFLKYYFDVVT